MFELILALQTAELPRTIERADVALLRRCLAGHPPAMGSNACLPIDEGVAALENCLAAASDQREAAACRSVEELECGNALHAAGVETSLVLQYCGLRNLAVLQALNTKQWEQAERRFAPGDYSVLRLSFLAQRAQLTEEISADSYELAWLVRPAAFYSVWVGLLDSALRETHAQDEPVPLSHSSSAGPTTRPERAL